MASAGGMMTVGPWSPPAWADFPGAPTRRYNLARTPTPVHRWHLPGTPDGCEVYIKRDDLTGMQLSGNKVRKLEFLLAEAMDRDADCVITIGGVQSNHCRATAVAARYLGLDSHLILRAPQSIAEDGDPGLAGNLLVERAVGANIHLVTKREYAAHGSVALAESLRRRLEREGKRPYVVPVGGSNATGTWGYVDAMAELAAQTKSDLRAHREKHGRGPFTDIVLACGSGGTAAGVALGAALCPELRKPNVWAYGVCDSPEYFYEYVGDILRDMGAPVKDIVGERIADTGASSSDGGTAMVGGVLRCVQAKGAGYAMATEEELATTAAVAKATGVLLDPVYSGKAAHGLIREMARDPGAWEGRRVLFVHTGGALGVYDKLAQLRPIMEATGPSRRFDVADVETA
jgi:D-cysteine desulfhydrase